MNRSEALAAKRFFTAHVRMFSLLRKQGVTTNDSDINYNGRLCVPERSCTVIMSLACPFPTVSSVPLNR